MLAAARQIAAGHLALEPQPVAGIVGYASRGHVLVAGPLEQVRAVAEALRALPHCTVLLTDGVADAGWRPPQAESRLYRGELVEVGGHLGRYEVSVRAGELLGNPRSIDNRRFFDLVFDLQTPPLQPIERRPPGYYAPAGDPAALAAALAEAGDLVGEFEKPVYIRYAPDLCARGASGLTGCTRCAEVCPAWAITPGAENIAIDTQLCQGIGPCA
ncbi:MAG TPA: hypothetical protein VIX81_11385, partial [Gammaproteobacteria bacterium]